MAYQFLSTILGIDANFTGNLGVGTTTPGAKLDVSTNAGRLRITQNTVGNTLNGLEFAAYNGTVLGGVLFNQSTGEIRLNTISSYFPTIYSNGAEVVRIPTSGNVLIGTTTDAGYKLYVNGSGTFSGELRLTGNLATGGNRNYILGSSADFEVTTNTVVKFRNYYNSSDIYFLLDYSNGGRATFSGASATGYRLTTSGSVTPSSAVARGAYFNNTLVASANSDVLVGVDISNTFTNGAYTGVTNLSLRVNGYTRLIGSDATGGRMIDVKNSSNTDCFYVRGYGDAYIWQTLYLGTLNGSSYISSGGLSIYSGSPTGNAFIRFIHNNGTNALRVLSNSNIELNPSAGNVLIGTTTDAGQRLQIAGNQATTLAGSGAAFNITRTGAYDNVTLTTLATITDTTSNANRAKTGLYVNVSAASTNIAIQTVGAVGVGVTPPSNSFASGYFSYLYAGATINSAGNYNLNVRSTVSSYAAGNGGGISFWGDDRGQAGANTAFAGVRGVKENSTYLNGLGALTFLTQASSAGLSTESTFAEVGRFTSGGNFLIGTTTNSGYKLDVNGTARATSVITDTITTTGSTTLAGYSGSTYTYGPLTANQSIYTFTFGFFNVLFGNITLGYVPKANTIGMGDSAIYNSGSNNVLIGSTTDNGNKLQVTGNVTVSSNISSSTLGVQNSAEINVNESGNNLLVYADITSGPDNLYSGGQVKANIYTSSVTTPTTINTGTTVSLMNWYPATTQGVMIDYVFYIDGGTYMRSGTFTAVNDTSGNAQYVDNATPDLNGSTSTVTFAAVNNGGTMEFQVTNTSGNPVYMNILTRYIPTLF